ncbi:MAG TPA: HAD family phosphatase [Candidatus Saccharimonadales bacterium]
MVKAIIFDYFGVVSSDEYWEFVDADKDVTSEFLSVANKVNLGKIHWQDFVQVVADKSNKSFEEVKAMYAEEQINPAILAFVQELHNKYKTGLITNAHHEFLEPIFDKTNLDSVFDAIIISSKVGIIKPDPRIYQLLLENLNVKAEETVFIDDIERNIAGAEAVGMNGLLYHNLERLKVELNRLLGH